MSLKLDHAGTRPGQQASIPPGAPSDKGRALSARAVLSRPPVNGVLIVFPGSAGEAPWCKWEGRYDITPKLVHLHGLPID